MRCRMGGCKDDSENSPDSCKNGQVQIMVNSIPFHLISHGTLRGSTSLLNITGYWVIVFQIEFGLYILKTRYKPRSKLFTDGAVLAAISRALNEPHTIRHAMHYHAMLHARAFKISIRVRHLFLLNLKRFSVQSSELFYCLGHMNSVDSSINTVYYAAVTQYTDLI